MRDDPYVVALVTRAAGSDQGAWNELVERYAPLVWAICNRYRLSSRDIEDVGQSVWLLLVEQLGKLREPAALPGWLATTTKRECLRVVTTAQRQGTRLDDTQEFTDDVMIDEEILRAERDAGLRAAFAELQADAVHDDQRSASFLRGDQRDAGDPGRKHRAAARTLPGPAAPVRCPHRPRCG
ncbi:MAG: sigma-70 family RNA polymerase sigma factor [Actinomycetota bacterium]|nr:sigma-70 family RNA polymerase sigma factor [Actinomycetota bacterium]